MLPPPSAIVAAGWRESVRGPRAAQFRQSVLSVIGPDYRHITDASGGTPYTEVLELSRIGVYGLLHIIEIASRPLDECPVSSRASHECYWEELGP